MDSSNMFIPDYMISPPKVPKQVPVQVAPIFRLPTELFVAIALIVVREYPPKSPYRSEDDYEMYWPAQGRLEPHALGWWGMCDVCSLWRKICLQTPLLWTRWVGRVPDAVSTFIARSGSTLPLHVDVQQNVLARDNVCTDIWHKLPLARVVSMSWALETEAHISDIVLLLSTSNPSCNQLFNLHTLNLWIDRFNNRATVDGSAQSLHLPALRSLHISRCLYVSINAPQLEVLTLGTPSSRVSIGLLHSLIGRSPRLRKLGLVDCEFDTTSGGSKLSLGNLEELSFEWTRQEPQDLTYEQIFDMFATMTTFPSTVSIKMCMYRETSRSVHIDVERRLWSAVPFAISSLAPNLPNALVFGPKTFTLVKCEDNISPEAVIWHNSVLPGSRPRLTMKCPTDSLLHAYLDLHQWNPEPVDCLQSITILSLQLDHSALGDTQNLLVMLHSLRHLRLGVKSSQMLPFIGLLDGTYAVDTVALPMLESIWLENPLEDGDREKDMPELNERASLRLLYAIIRARRQLLPNAGPRVLYLQDFDYIDGDEMCVQDLEELLDEVVFVQSNPRRSSFSHVAQ